MSLIRNCAAAVAIVLSCVGLSYSPSASAAQTVPATFTQQGRLLDAAGVPVDGVALEFTFSL